MQSGFVLALMGVFVGAISHVAAAAERIEAPIRPLSEAAMRAAASDWATVQALQPSTPITVKTTSGLSCEPDPCRFASADHTTLRVADDKALRKTYDILRIDVREVSVASRQWKSGALIGGLAGLISSIAAPIGMMGVFATSGDALWGAWIGRAFWRHRVIYRSDSESH